jgi:hypothetical protein
MKINKPVGEIRPLTITASEIKLSDGRFVFPSKKDEIELKIARLFFKICSQDSKFGIPADSELIQTVENDIDFSIKSAHEEFLLELTEMIPPQISKGGFANLPYQLNAGEYFDSIANLIQKKSNKYVGIQKGIRLLIYITDDRCNPSLAVEKLLINFLHTQKHNFERIYFFIPILENEGITMQYFPQANPILLSHAEVIQCRQIQITNLVFK